MKNQKGYIAYVVIVFEILLALLIFPIKFPSLGSNALRNTTTYCRDFVKDPNPPTVEAPAYDHDGIIPDSKRTYRLIKQNVLMSSFYYNPSQWEHFYSDFKEHYEAADGKKYVMRIPNGVQGRSYIYSAETGAENFLTFADYGLLYLFHADDDYNIEKFPQLEDLITVDLYKTEDLPGLPEWVTKCFDTSISDQFPTDIIDFSKRVAVPDQLKSLNHNQLQLEWFLFDKEIYIRQAWWTPHCKPAVYLYPEKKQLVNVKVFPKGELSLTDPYYDPSKGWTVEANPLGKLSVISSQLSASKYDYLYYESKLYDSEIKKPTAGWSVKSGEMENLLNEILPKLGLNKKEQADFMDYWLTKLPKSPYYFVGLVDKPQRDYLEALEVTPKPDTSIRFSLFFEPIDQSVNVIEPKIETPKRNGFTLVDWGGMIKLHPGTPFTCSQ